MCECHDSIQPVALSYFFSSHHTPEADPRLMSLWQECVSTFCDFITAVRSLLGSHLAATFFMAFLQRCLCMRSTHRPGLCNSRSIKQLQVEASSSPGFTRLSNQPRHNPSTRAPVFYHGCVVAKLHVGGYHPGDFYG